MSFHILVLKFKTLSSEDEFSKTHLLEDGFSKSYPLENDFHLMEFSKQERYEKCRWMLSILTVFIELDRPLSPREPRKLHSFFHNLSLAPLLQWSLYESELFSSKKRSKIRVVVPCKKFGVKLYKSTFWLFRCMDNYNQPRVFFQLNQILFFHPLHLFPSSFALSSTKSTFSLLLCINFIRWTRHKNKL